MQTFPPTSERAPRFLADGFSFIPISAVTEVPLYLLIIAVVFFKSLIDSVEHENQIAGVADAINQKDRPEVERRRAKRALGICFPYSGRQSLW